ncbi:hypothetical protein BDY17DRAFT_202518 [Neohortaea acidophila]|uniref:Uncharacterized protein n=1 Tax=Neohortaea acidophila TaxID=245834 RepID=A0A6A6PM75_9PEZI|nr:uncharacterized protein BDY17DRAFT_202518 [Neohortaea acidophila]KAF2480916.1 hypothetical protein BDY17DRAFT_202518 [Neohortaea acidophila]
MRFTTSIAAAILAFAATGVLAAPLPQLAGFGSGSDSIFTDTDNGVGYGVENAEDNLAGTIAGAKGGSSTPAQPGPTRRQLAGVGSGSDSIFTDTDNGVGYGVENAEDNLAGNLKGESPSTSPSQSGSGSSSSGPPPPPPPPPSKRRRQLNKVAAGEQTLANAAGVGSSTEGLTNEENTLDGDGTNGAAEVGAAIGSTEASTLENAGNQVPKKFRRQLNKVAAGEQTLANAAGVGSETESTTNEENTLDGDGTNDAANAGAEIGSTEETTLEEAGNLTP